MKGPFSLTKPGVRPFSCGSKEVFDAEEARPKPFDDAARVLAYGEPSSNLPIVVFFFVTFIYVAGGDGRVADEHTREHTHEHTHDAQTRRLTGAFPLVCYATHARCQRKTRGPHKTARALAVSGRGPARDRVFLAIIIFFFFQPL